MLYTDGTRRAGRYGGGYHARKQCYGVDESGEITKARVRPARGNGPSVSCSHGHYSGSARTSVGNGRVLILFVPQRGQSNHTPNLFFHQSFIPQPRDCQTGGRGIDSLLGQDHKLIAILFVAKNKRDEKAVPDVL